MATNPDEIFKKHLLSVDDYHRMGEAGILKQQDRVELIEGEIVDMAPIGSKHASVVNKLAKILITALRDAAIVSIQNPVLIGTNNEPQPDIVLLKPCNDYYEYTLPTAKDSLLLIEVADSSLKFDIEVKIPLFAKHNIPQVWLVDLDNSKLLSYSAPDNGRYSETKEINTGELISVPSLPNTLIDLSKLFLSNS